MYIALSRAALTDEEQSALDKGFDEHGKAHAAPAFDKRRVKYVACNEEGELAGILTADILWDWLYIDELWVAPNARGSGLGSKLISSAETLATSENLEGVWLWTQSWQAEGFYQRLGYEVFTRFENFPRGHSRIGLRKQVASPPIS